MAEGIFLIVLGMAGIVFGMVADSFSTGFVASKRATNAEMVG
jgi:hypothetical protein